MGIFRRQAPATKPDFGAVADIVAAQVIEQVKAALPAPVGQPLTAFDQAFTTGAFGPGVPLRPYGIDPRDPSTGVTEPRRSEYETSVNMQINGSAGRLTPFSVLRDVADRVDVMRRCIEVRKAQMLALDWDITLTRQATRRVMAENDLTSPGKAAQLAREKYEPEMIRLREWWETPDSINGMDFTTWLQTLLEEQLVIDAATVWPVRNLGGDVVAFEVLDGTTIKPLLDRRGSTPRPPAPAFQQVLYGFPRGEFTSTSGVDGEFRSDQLVYRPKNRRTWTPYGDPETERALFAADVYLKRMAWIRGEFTENRTPSSWIETPADSTMQPSQVAEWETAINAELADPTARRQLRMLPPGSKATAMADFANLYKPELDEALVKLITMCFGVMPTEIGFPPTSGLGGKGHQEGEANSAWRKTVRPQAGWVESLLTELSRRFLGMPNELQFTLLGYEVEDQGEAEKVADSQTRRGAATLNEDRAKRGLPLYDFEEADSPFIVTPSGLVFLDGAATAGGAVAESDVVTDVDPISALDTAEIIDNGIPEEGDPTAAVEEAAKFVTFARKRHGKAWRDFKFQHVAADLSKTLNLAGKSAEFDLIKTLVADLGKKKARHVTPAEKAAIIATHAARIHAAILALLPPSDELVSAWQEREALTKGTDTADAESYIREAADADYGDLDAEIADLIKAGHSKAWAVAWVTEDDELDPGYDDEDPPSRLQRLLDAVPVTRTDLIVATVGVVAGALLSENPTENLTDALTYQADTFATVEITATLTAGTLDSAERQQIAHVQLVASAGECEFCAGYDGRIMPIDHEEGMPPLHNGCSCDVEPLD